MRRLRALARRRSYGENSTDPTNSETPVRRSLDSPRHRTTLKKPRPNAHQTHSRRGVDRAVDTVDSSGQSESSRPRHPMDSSHDAPEHGKSTEWPLKNAEMIDRDASQPPKRDALEGGRLSTLAGLGEPTEHSPVRMSGDGNVDGLVIFAKDEHLSEQPKVERNEDSATEGKRNTEAHASARPVLDLTNTVDTEETTTYAPAVIHEVVRPEVHEIVEEQIYREIHEHDVYHRIQPVFAVETLPARHFVPGPNGGLVEVAADQLPFPECAEPNQQWFLGRKQLRAVQSPIDQPVPTINRDFAQHNVDADI
ncbi:hypothetical protein GGR54DRAFT_467567 [Hypoxylon sp. NC1633]|nr:hypothetical protein GGR54DRAFT_467567 [Hypoxylon sp. NC1633]